MSFRPSNTGREAIAERFGPPGFRQPCRTTTEGSAIKLACGDPA